MKGYIVEKNMAPKHIVSNSVRLCRWRQQHELCGKRLTPQNPCKKKIERGTIHDITSKSVRLRETMMNNP